MKLKNLNPKYMYLFIFIKLKKTKTFDSFMREVPGF